jgi:hypothetical protein
MNGVIGVMFMAELYRDLPWRRGCSWHRLRKKLRAAGDFQRKGLTVSGGLDGIRYRYHYNDIGYEGRPNRTQDREPQAATRRARAHASRQPERSVQRVRQDWLPLQRLEEPTKARPQLSAQFYLAGKGRTRFVRSVRLAEVRLKVANYKRFRELTDAWVDLVVQLEQQEREQKQ